MHSMNPSGISNALAALALLTCGCHPGAELAASQRTLGEDLVIGPEWTVLEPEPPLLVQPALDEMVLHHSPALTLTRAPGAQQNAVYCPRLAETIHLDIELVRGDGSTEKLASGGISPGRLGMRARRPGTGSDFEVERLRLRSDHPFAVSKLEWRALAGMN